MRIWSKPCAHPHHQLPVPSSRPSGAYHVGVSDESDGEDTIEDGVDGSDGGGSYEGDEGCAKEALKGPVVRSMSLVRGRKDDGIVDGSHDVWGGGQNALGSAWVSGARERRTGGGGLGRCGGLEEGGRLDGCCATCGFVPRV
mgnify:FL=1